MEGVSIHGKRWNKIIFKVLLNPNHFVILWNRVWEKWKIHLLPSALFFPGHSPKQRLVWVVLLLTFLKNTQSFPAHRRKLGYSYNSLWWVPVVHKSHHFSFLLSFCLDFLVSGREEAKTPQLRSLSDHRVKDKPVATTAAQRLLEFPLQPCWSFVNIQRSKVIVRHLIPPFLSGTSPYLACVCAGNVSRADVFPAVEDHLSYNKLITCQTRSEHLSVHMSCASMIKKKM